MQDLAGRFNKAQLVDKLVNIGGDLSPDELRRLGTFKSATGGDTILVEEKMERPYSAKLFARHVYSTNRQFAARDDSGALTERFYPIVFQKKWRGQAGERSPEEMHSMLCDEEELIGVVTKALRFLPRVRAMRSLPIPKSVKEALDELESATDPFKRWFDLAIELEGPEGSYLPIPVAVGEYNCFLHQLYPNLAPLSADAFGRRMAKMLKNEKRQHVVRGKHGVWCYERVCLRYDTLTAGEHLVGEGWGPHCNKGKQPGVDLHAIGFDLDAKDTMIVRKDWRS